MNACFAIIKNEENKVLLLLRNDMPLWELPGGGVENKETFESACLREILEETGCAAQIDYPVGVYVKQNGAIIKTYCCKLLNAVAEPQEIYVATSWFAANELPQNTSLAQQLRIAHALSYQMGEPLIHHYEQHALASLDLLKSLPVDNLYGYKQWKTHPEVQRKRALGLLKFWVD